MVRAFILSACAAVFVAPLLASPQPEPPQPVRPEAVSLAGVPLYPPEPIPNREQLLRDLQQVQSLANTTTPEAIIWMGRRQAYLWRYRDAIETFTKGIARYPNDARMYRHRGHRYITTRQFDSARKDLEKAASLIRGRADEVEPDGAPNPSGQPRSTLQFNIWYHLGLTHFLRVTSGRRSRRIARAWRCRRTTMRSWPRVTGSG